MAAPLPDFSSGKTVRLPPIRASRSLLRPRNWSPRDGQRRLSLSTERGSPPALVVFLKIAERLRELSLPVKIGIVSALFALVIGIRVFTWNRSASLAKVAASPSLGLQVKRDGTKFLVAWNPSAPVIANAKDANLVIWDASREAWDGSSEPLYMPLTPAQLRSGSVTYTSFSFTEKVKFRLDTVGKSGDAASESMVSVSPASISSPTSSSAPPAPEHAAGIASLPVCAPKSGASSNGKCSAL